MTKSGGTRWVARLAPPVGGSVGDLLRLPLALDVWERHKDALVVAATEGVLAEMERRHLARISRIERLEDYERRMRAAAATDPSDGSAASIEREGEP